MTVTKNSNGSYSFEIKPRDESPAAREARLDDVIGTVHPYWIQRRKQWEKAQAARQQARKRKKTLTLFK